MSILVFIIVLSILVMIHEFGHFIAAKRAGIGVEEFGFGLPPRLWGKKVKGTIYSINWLPFGGFVKLVGEDPTDKKRDQKDSFYHKSLWHRTRVVVAGVFMNTVLAVVIFYIVLFALGFKVNLPLIFEHKFKFVNETRQVLVADIESGTPAEAAGLQITDSIVAIGDEKIESLDELQQIVRTSENKTLKLIVENPINNAQRVIEATPKYNERIKAPALGIGLGELVVLNYDEPWQKVFAGFIHSFNLIDYSIDGFGDLIGSAISSGDISPVSEGVSGPVGIAQITSDAVSTGPLSVLQLMGLLSLNLAFLNILPIPALDGGRFAFLIYEVFSRRKPNANVEKWVHSIGFAFLIGLIVLITFNDIAKLFR